MTARTANGPTTFGFCHTEELVRTGVVASKTSADEYHRLCPGAMASGIRCACPHHVDEEIVPDDIATACGRCGYTRADSLRHPTENGFRCTDVAECNVRYDRKMKDNPAFRAAVEFRARAEEARQELARREAEAGGGTSRARYGRCEYSGLPTKGGRFLPGNDAKLNPQLLAEAKQGKVDSLAEVIARGWPVKESGWDPRFLRSAEEAASREGFVEARTESRWARLEGQ